ncbi:hypothetical protein AO366_0001 [Moraxella catarrhalis]|uniref:hypothetical protein n=1 Tax=Moraxella catarrhalis TaxID=480 RepID=UPI0007E46B09|nr:hypothetical protein [Moraxella catarrhalis]OAV35399.1 hypothetical protein AO366_0001 [Moraxella catarrhalis]
MHGLAQSPLTFEGDTGTAVTKKLGDTLKVQGGQTDTNALTDNNIGVVANGDTLNIQLAKTLSGLDAVNTATLNASDKVTVGSGNNTAQLQNGGLTFTQPNTAATPTTNSKTIYGNDGLKFTDGSDKAAEGTTRITRDKIGFAGGADGSLDTNKSYLDKDKLKVGDVEIKNTGIDAGGKAISNVGEAQQETDAVTYKQHKQVADKLKDLEKTDIDKVKTALQTFTVKKHDATNENETITVGKETKDGQVNTLTLKGENGLTVATKKADGTVTFGLNQDSGLTIGNSTLNNGGLTVKNTDGNEQIQVGADGIKFADVNGNDAGASKAETAIMTKTGFGFNNGSGTLDKSKPHLSLTGIDAGNQEISNVKSAINPATNGGQPDFVTRLGRAGTNPSKQNSAATVKDLHGLAQSPLTFEGDTGTAVTKKLGDTLKVQGGQTDTNALTDNNIGVVANGDTLNIQLAKTLSGLDAVNTATLNASDKVTVGSGNNTAQLQNGGLTFTQPNTAATPTTNSKTIYGNDGLKFTDGSDKAAEGTTRITRDKIGFAGGADGSLDTNKSYLDKDKLKVGDVEIKNTGIDAGGKAISNVGEAQQETDAVTYKQHKQVADKLKDLEKTDIDKVKTALQTFTVKKHDATNENETITVGKETKDGQVNTLTLKGENGLTVATKKADGTVTFGLNQDSGLTIGNSTLNNGGLTVKNTDGNEQIQVGADGIKFADVNGNDAGASKAETAIMTKTGFGFNNGSGTLDKSKPHLSLTGIDAGNQEISNVKSAINPATNGGQPDFVTRLGRAGTNPSKQNSAATVKDLHGLAQSPLTFEGDTGTAVTKNWAIL